MKTWIEVSEYIRKQWPQTKRNLLITAKQDQRFRDAGIEPAPMPAILREAIKIAKADK